MHANANPLKKPDHQKGPEWAKDDRGEEGDGSE